MLLLNNMLAGFCFVLRQERIRFGTRSFYPEPKILDPTPYVNTIPWWAEVMNRTTPTGFKRDGQLEADLMCRNMQELSFLAASPCARKLVALHIKVHPRDSITETLEVVERAHGNLRSLELEMSNPSVDDLANMCVFTRARLRRLTLKVAFDESGAFTDEIASAFVFPDELIDIFICFDVVAVRIDDALIRKALLLLNRRSLHRIRVRFQIGRNALLLRDGDLVDRFEAVRSMVASLHATFSIGYFGFKCGVVEHQSFGGSVSRRARNVRCPSETWGIELYGPQLF